MGTCDSCSPVSLSDITSTQHTQQTSSQQHLWSEVDALLKELHLTEYNDVLRSEGYDRMEALYSITIDDLRTMKIKQGHANVLLNHIKQHKNSNSTQSTSIHKNNDKIQYTLIQNSNTEMDRQNVEINIETEIEEQQILYCDGKDPTECKSGLMMIRLLKCYQQQSYSVEMNEVEILNNLFHIKYSHRMNEDDLIFTHFYDYLISEGITPCDVSNCDAMQYHYRDRTKDKHNDTKEDQIKDLICRLHCYFMHSFDINKLTKEEIQQIEQQINNINDEGKEELVLSLLTKKWQSVSSYTNQSKETNHTKEIADNDLNKDSMIKKFSTLMDTDLTASESFLSACDWMFDAAIDCFFVCNGETDTLKQKIVADETEKQQRDVYYNIKDDSGQFCEWLQYDEYDTDALYYDLDNDNDSNVFNYFISDKMKDNKMFKYHKLRQCVTKQFNWNEKRDAEDDDDYGSNEFGNDVVQIYNRGVKYWYWEQMKEDKMYVAAKYEHLKEEILDNDMMDCDIDQWNGLHNKCDTVYESNYVKGFSSNNNDDNVKIYGIWKGDTITLEHVYSIKLYTDYTAWCSTFCSVFRRGKIGIDTYESLESMKMRAAKFAHWARLLTEVVQCFGYLLTDDNQVFYRGIKGTFTFSSFIARYNVPLSTSWDRFEARKFASDDGFMLSLVQYENHHSFHFNCERFSCHDNEKEELFFGGDTILKIKTIHEFSTHPKNYKYFVEAAQQILRLIRGDQMELSLSKDVKNTITNLFKHCLDIKIIPNLPIFIANGIFYYLEHTPIPMKLNMNELMKKYQWIKKIFVKHLDDEDDLDVLNIKNICNLFQYSKHIVISMANDFILNHYWCSSIYSDLKDMKHIKLELEWETSMCAENKYMLEQFTNKFNNIQWEMQFKPQSVIFIWNRNLEPKALMEENVKETITDRAEEYIAQRMISIEWKQDAREQELQGLDDDGCDIDGLLRLISSEDISPRSFLINERAALLSELVKSVFECDSVENEHKYPSIESFEVFSNGYFRELESEMEITVLRLIRKEIMKYYDYYLRCIDIQKVRGDILEYVVSYLKHHNGRKPDEIAKPIRSVKMERIVADLWDADFINKMNKKTIFQVILAANYMDIPSLLHLGCAKIATLIKGKSPEEIKRILADDDEDEKSDENDVLDEDNDSNNKDSVIQSFSNTKLTFKSSKRLLDVGNAPKRIDRIRSLDKDDWPRLGDGHSSEFDTEDEDDCNPN